jgi:hypothetical protein
LRPPTMGVMSMRAGILARFRGVLFPRYIFTDLIRGEELHARPAVDFDADVLDHAGARGLLA